MRFDDPAAFFAHAAPFLEQREAENNVILGLRARLERDRHSFGEEDPYLAVAEDGGEVVAVAFRTPPHSFGLAATNRADTVDASADDLRGIELPGVFGPHALPERL